MITKKLRIRQFIRKPIVNYSYSIEFIFKTISSYKSDNIEIELYEAKFSSKGFFKRIFLLVDSYFKRKEINHVTGDIHFIGLVLKKNSTIHTYHDMGFMTYPERGVKHLLLKYLWLQIPATLCRFITVPSEATKNELLKYCNIDHNKIQVIPNFISDSFFPSLKPFNKYEPRILQIGVLGHKNVIRLIHAVKEIKCKLVIIGAKKNDYIQMLKNLNINYEYYENLSQTQVIEQYQFADIVTVCSIFEGFGMPILEAQRSGKVVITSNTSSMPEVAGKGAHFISPFDVESNRAGILKVINNQEYRNMLIKFGFENEKRFNKHEIINKYFKLYSLCVK